MNIKLLIEDNTTMKGYEVQQLVSGTINVSNELFDSVGKMEFKLVKSDDYKIANGNTVYLYVDGKGIFKGYVFKIKESEKNTIDITVYNQLRYLKLKDTIVLEPSTASDIFTNLCKKFNIIYNIKDASSVVIPSSIQDNKSLYEIFTYAIEKTLIDSGKWYGIIDRFGILEFVDLENLVTNLIIGDNSLATSYSYEKSIDSDTYNQIKLIKENKDTGKRDVYIVKDSSTINKWGLLQHFESVDEGMNEAQIKQRAEMLLKVKNRETQTLKVSCLGDFRINVGNGISIDIKDLNEINNKNYIITSCTHKITDTSHTMDITLQLGV